MFHFGSELNYIFHSNDDIFEELIRFGVWASFLVMLPCNFLYSCLRSILGGRLFVRLSIYRFSIPSAPVPSPTSLDLLPSFTRK